MYYDVPFRGRKPPHLQRPTHTNCTLAVAAWKWKQQHFALHKPSVNGFAGGIRAHRQRSPSPGIGSQRTKRKQINFNFISVSFKLKMYESLFFFRRHNFSPALHVLFILCGAFTTRVCEWQCSLSVYIYERESDFENVLFVGWCYFFAALQIKFIECLFLCLTLIENICRIWNMNQIIL